MVDTFCFLVIPCFSAFRQAAGWRLRCRRPASPPDGKPPLFPFPRVVAIALGAEDYRADLRTGKHKPAVELLFARQTILHAAREAGIRVIDTVFSDVKDPQGFREEVEFIKALGYDGKSCIHPSQIKIIHEVFTPDEKEIAHSVKVLNSYADALRNNKGVISVDGKMIDGPIVVRAQRVVDKARAAGIKVELEEGAEYDVK